MPERHRVASEQAGVPLAMEMLTPDHAEEVYRLHLEAVASLGDLTLVKPEAASYFTGILTGRGIIFGLRHEIERRLVGYGVLQYDVPLKDEARVALGLGVLANPAKLSGASIDQAYRGHQLQRVLIRQRVEHARAAGYGLVFVTSAPGNVASWSNLLLEGFRIGALAHCYGGARFILERPLGSTPAPDLAAATWVDVADTARIHQRLALGERAVASRGGAAGGRSAALELGFVAVSPIAEAALPAHRNQVG